MKSIFLNKMHYKVRMIEIISLVKLKNYMTLEMETHFVIYIIIKEVIYQVYSVKAPTKIESFQREIYKSFK